MSYPRPNPMPLQTWTEREGFARGDRVKLSGAKLATLPDGRSSLPADGVVNIWSQYEYGPGVHCCVTFGDRYIGRYDAWELEHDDRTPTEADRRMIRRHRAEDRRARR